MRLLLLLVPSLALADRPECEKAGGKWTTDATGSGCMLAGKRDGVWEQRTTAGQLARSVAYKKGALDGPTVAFNVNTCKPSERGAFANDKKHGMWTTWDVEGLRTAEGPFKDGVRDGVWKFFLDNVAVMEGPMVNDSANGVFTERFTTGTEWRKAEVKDGQRTTPEAVACKDRGGEWEIDHKKREEGCLVEGMRQSTWLGYSPEGKLAWRAEYVNNVESGEHVDYHPTGEVMRRGRVVDGVPDGLHEFKSATGQLFGASTIEKGAGAWKAFHPSGLVAEEGNYRGGKRDGVWREYFPKGALRNETTFEFGQRHGAFREHYPTGEVQVTGTYAYDSRIGQWSSFYMNGKIGWTGPFGEEGDADGPFFFGDFHGTPAAFGTMRSGGREGVWTLFHDNGNIAGIGVYANGRKNGTWFEWWPSGKFWRTVQYANDREDSVAARACFAIPGGAWFADDTERALGCQVCRTETAEGPITQLKTGAWTWWHANAAVEKQGMLELGARTGRWQSWFDNGQLMLENTFADDKEQGPSRGYYRDGRARFVGAYRDGKEDGEWITNHADGTLASIGRFDAGKKVGRWTYNYLGGAIKEAGDYADGAPTGEWVTYHPDGKKAAAGTYVAGKREGTWTYWRPDGSVWRTETFVGGKRVAK